MKRIGQIAVIALFVAALWVPVLCTPSRFQQERKLLTVAERRVPLGALGFKASGGNIEQWVESIQDWYRDSFAFRGRFLNLYNAAHYVIRNYPDEVFGADGCLLKRNGIEEALVPLTNSERKQMEENLKGLQMLCKERGIPCVFIIIPSKLTIHPHLAPRWVSLGSFAQRRNELAEIIRNAQLPVFDLSPHLKLYAEQTKQNLFLKYDPHWNTLGAIEGYRGIMAILSSYCSEARAVPSSAYQVTEEMKSTWFPRKRYLDFMLSEQERRLFRINLPPVRVISGGKEQTATLNFASRHEVKEVFCPRLGSQTVLFIRDSFFTAPSALLNHSLPHSVYMNYSKQGRDPRAAIERYQPDLLVVALQESRVKRALLGLVITDQR